MNLVSYVFEHSERGACRCGRCLDATRNPQPEGKHTSNLYFFEVAARGEPTAADLRLKIAEHKGEFVDMNPLDGKEHGYIEIGGWIGDQGAALQFMGLGEILGLWEILQPGMLPLGKPMQDAMAGAGYISIKGAT